MFVRCRKTKNRDEGEICGSESCFKAKNDILVGNKLCKSF
jgi:hypothetical protein